MSSFRHHIRRHRRLAMLLVMVALLVKVLVPAGFMTSASAGSITIELCSGYGPQMAVMALPGAGDHKDAPAGHAKDAMPCAFSGLGASSLAAVDPFILAVAIAFIIATVFRIAAISSAIAPAYVRPPLRGPPVTA